MDIHGINFGDGIEDDGDYFFFAWDGLPDRLAIYKPTGRIVSFYPGTNAINFQCALNSEKFLEVLIEIMTFYKEKGFKHYDENTLSKRSKEVAYIAALKAGGEEFEDYYKSLLWVE